MSEIWRPIANAPGYEVSSLGRVRSLRFSQPRVLATYPDKRGYLRVRVFYGDVTRLYVHILVAQAFHGDRPEGYHTRHLDGDMTNNAASNLQYGTPSENCLDSVQHGTHHNASKTQCSQGHPYDEANTYQFGTRRGCRACNREAVRRLKVRKQAAA